MHAKCLLNRGCSPGCRRVTPPLCSHPWVWTNWFVPSGRHLERGHRYGMHTSPLEVAGVIVAPVPSTLGPRQQLPFIYIHSCFPESRTGNGRGMVIGRWEFVIAAQLLLFLGFKKQCYHTTFTTTTTFFYCSISKPSHSEKVFESLCDAAVVLAILAWTQCYVFRLPLMSYLWVLVCGLDCSHFLFVFSTNRMHPKSHKELVGFRNILYSISFNIFDHSYLLLFSLF